MLIEKEFYFVRHGQTDHNVSGNKGEHYDIPLNETGRLQALKIEPLVSSFPVKTICFSPLKRVKETKEILTPKLLVPKKEILDLSECSCDVWHEMRRLGPDALQDEGIVGKFFQKVKSGINQALSEEGPVLVVAHGGVHFALCCMMNVEQEWVIDNCVPVHFVPKGNGSWSAKKFF